MSAPASPLLSPSQLAALAAIGEERSARVGELLFEFVDGNCALGGAKQICALARGVPMITAMAMLNARCIMRLLLHWPHGRFSSNGKVSLLA